MRQHHPSELIRAPVRHVAKEADGTGYVEVIDSFVPRGLGQLIDRYRLNRARKVLITRDGNIGDVLMMGPTLRHLHREYPHLEMHVATREIFLPLIEDIEWITRHPLETLVVDDAIFPRAIYDEVVDLHPFVERSPRQYVVDRVTLFGEAFGLALKPMEGGLLYRVRPEEDRWARQWIAENAAPELPLVALAPWATDPRRTWPDAYSREFAALVASEAQTVVFHHNEGMRSFFEDIPNVLFFDHYSIREAGAVLSRCNCIVSVDTGMYHLGAAVQRRPTDTTGARPFLFVILGQWPPELRMPWYHNYKAFCATELNCVPCYAQ